MLMTGGLYISFISVSECQFRAMTLLEEHMVPYAYSKDTSSKDTSSKDTSSREMAHVP